MRAQHREKKQDTPTPLTSIEEKSDNVFLMLDNTLELFIGKDSLSMIEALCYIAALTFRKYRGNAYVQHIMDNSSAAPSENELTTAYDIIRKRIVDYAYDRFPTKEIPLKSMWLLFIHTRMSEYISKTKKEARDILVNKIYNTFIAGKDLTQDKKDKILKLCNMSIYAWDSAMFNEKIIERILKGIIP